MTVAPIPGQIPAATGYGQPHSRLARWAVGLSAASVATIATSIIVFAIAYGFGGWDAIEDNWVGFLVAVMALGPGLFGSLAAFALAIVAKIRRERWTLLWLPLCAFPAFLAFLVLGEAFWWE